MRVLNWIVLHEKYSQISALYESEKVKMWKLYPVANVLKILLTASYKNIFSVGGLLKEY